MKSEFKKGTLVTLRSGSGTMVVVGNPTPDLVEVLWMGGIERGVCQARVPACALKGVEVKKTKRTIVDREVVTKVR